MRIVVCLHAAASVRAAPRLHATDRRALALARALATEVVALEAVTDAARTPIALGEALAAGADRGVQVAAEALGKADARTGGFVMAAAIDRLQVDLVLFGGDADPESAADVPGAIAHHMAAVYLVGVEELALAPDAPPGAASPATPAFDATVRGGGWRRRLRLTAGGVLGIAPAAPASAAAKPAAPPEAEVTVWTLADLNLDQTLIRRRDDRRGVVEASARPLVTLESAAALAALISRAG